MKFDSLLTLFNLRTADADIVKTISTAAENDLYRATLMIQDELAFDEIQSYLIAQPKWAAAKNVLDLGCGPGDLLNKLAAFFPDKRFTGVDLNPDFLDEARRLAQGLGNVRFLQSDLYTFAAGSYDFVILKAVLQHLKEPDRFLKHLPGLLNEDAAVLFIDTTRENYIAADPPIEAFNRLYAQLETVQKQHTGSRDCMDELQGRLGLYDFRLLDARTPSVPVTTVEGRLQAIQYLMLASATVKKMMPALALDLRDLICDLLAWYDASAPRLSIKSRRLLIERNRRS